MSGRSSRLLATKGVIYSKYKLAGWFVDVGNAYLLFHLVVALPVLFKNAKMSLFALLRALRTCFVLAVGRVYCICVCIYVAYVIVR